MNMHDSLNSRRQSRHLAEEHITDGETTAWQSHDINTTHSKLKNLTAPSKMVCLRGSISSVRDVSETVRPVVDAVAKRSPSWQQQKMKRDIVESRVGVTIRYQHYQSEYEMSSKMFSWESKPAQPYIKSKAVITADLPLPRPKGFYRAIDHGQSIPVQRLQRFRRI